MSAVISYSDYFQLCGVLSVDKPCLAFNNPTFITKHVGLNKECFVLLVHEADKIQGSVSWQDSGFDFSIRFGKNPSNGKYNIIYRTVNHLNWQNKYNSWIDRILEDLVDHSIIKINDVIGNKKVSINGQNLDGYYFKKKSIGKLTPTYKANLSNALASNLISKDFRNFAMKFGTRFVLSKY